MVMVYLAMQTSKFEDQDFTLQKVVGPTWIDNCMKRLIAIDPSIQPLIQVGPTTFCNVKSWSSTLLVCIAK